MTHSIYISQQPLLTHTKRLW